MATSTSSLNLEEALMEDLASVHDSRLVELVRQGQRSAFAELVRRYEKKLLRTIYRLVGNAAMAEDLAQEAFLRSFNRLEKFDTSKRFGPWLFQIAVNLSIDHLRRKGRRGTISLNDMTDDNRPFDVSDPDPQPAYELSQEVHFVLRQLPESYRSVLVLRDLEGFACSEVAAIIGRKEPTVRWRLLRAREMFRELWEKRQGNDTDESEA